MTLDGPPLEEALPPGVLTPGYRNTARYMYRIYTVSRVYPCGAARAPWRLAKHVVPGGLQLRGPAAPRSIIGEL